MVGRRYVSLAEWARHHRQRLQDEAEATNEPDVAGSEAGSEPTLIAPPLPEEREAA